MEFDNLFEDTEIKKDKNESKETEKGKLEDIFESNKQELTLENLIASGIMSSHASWAFDRKPDIICVIGPKESGKTYPVKVREIYDMHHDFYCSTQAARKYSTAASKKLGGYAMTAYNIMRQEFDITDCRYVSNNFYMLHKSKREMMKNNSQGYFSLEDITGSTDGGSVPNAGYIGTVHVDEPVVKEDVGDLTKIPDEKEWASQLRVIRSNFGRSVESFNDRMGRKEIKGWTEKKMQMFFTMNPWGDHPLIIQGEEHFPEKDFIMHQFGFDIFQFEKKPEALAPIFKDEKLRERIITNCVMTKDVEIEKVKYKFVRNNIFANPLKIKKQDEIFANIEKALVEGDRTALMIVLGTKAMPNIREEMMTYPAKMSPNLVTLDDYKENGYKIHHMTFPWDVDTSRVLTFAPTYHMRKINNLGVLEERIHTGWVESHKVKGTRHNIQLNLGYMEFMKRRMNEHYEEVAKYFEHPNVKAHIFIDLQSDWYVLELSKSNNYPHWASGIGKPPKIHNFSIAMRQQTTINGYNSGRLTLDPRNVDLLNDYKVNKKAVIDKPTRQDKGGKNYNDRIDASEYGITLYWGIILGGA